jgi:hypothetical protein
MFAILEDLALAIGTLVLAALAGYAGWNAALILSHMVG